jgi:hypothetical protein
VLCHPEAVDEWFSRAGRAVKPQAVNVRHNTVQARRFGIPVRWHKPFLGIAITFVNPKSEDGWAVIELTIPQQEPALRPAFRIRRKHHAEAYDNLWATYSKLWEVGCDEPPAKNGDE